MRKKSVAPSLFPAGADLPLFSGVAMRAQVKPFTPSAEHQPALFSSCPLCFGSGQVITRKGKKPIPCPCQLNK